MKEVDFDFLIKYLEWEIARLTNANRLEMPGYKEPDISSSMTAGMVEFLTTLLQWVKSAVKIERDRIQSARDSIDATLYDLMSKSSIKFDDDFKKMLDHASGNALSLHSQSVAPHENKVSKESCLRMAYRLELLRLKLKSRAAETAVEKIAKIQQDDTLLESTKMLKSVAENL